MMITFAIVATVLIIGLFSQVVKGQTPEEAQIKQQYKKALDILLRWEH
jgi:hypothetical protein